MLMRITILALFLLSILNVSIAQTKKIDSLNNLISKSKSDTARINLLVKKIRLVRNQNIDSSILINKAALINAQKIGYYKGEIDLRNNLVTSFCFKGDYKSAEENLKFLGDFIKATPDSADFADYLSNYGMMYGMQSKYDTSIQYYERAIGINERKKNTKELAGNYSNVAIGFQQLANFPQALVYQQKSLKLAEQLNNEVQQAYTLVNMGITYTLIRDSLRAEQAYSRSIKLAQGNHLRDVELYAYTNLSSLYIKQDRWNEGYEFAMKAAVLAGKTGDQGTEAASFSKAAVCLAYTDKFSEAIALGQKAILIADSSGQPLNIYQGYSSMGNILKLQKKYAEAIPNYEKAFAALKEADAYDPDIGIGYKELSECYEQTGNLSNALASFKKYALIEDSVRSKDNVQKATELNMNYEFDKKKALSDALQAKKNAEAQTKQLLLLGGLLLALILAIAALFAYRNKQKANRKLEIQKGEIQSTLSKLETTQAQLIQSEKMASLGELTAGIAHEIQNPLNFVKNFSEVSTELIDDMEEELRNGKKETAIIIAENLRGNLAKITHHSLRADGIVKGMLQHSRTSTGLKEPTNINNLADEYLRLSYHGLRAKDKSFNASLKTDFDERLSAPSGKIKLVTQDIGRVLLNLFTNAFYAVADKKRMHPDGYDPTVSVTTKKEHDKVIIRVKDNGNGIPEDITEKIFQPFFTTKPTGQGTGLGLSLSYDIIKTHGGEIKVETKEGEGTEFVITLPMQEIA
ncbi:MAG: tetratricopeptide repeat protein [Ginsengibacter sp.]